jgi:ferric-dicitrate binding protein FerR (iron transport regulator)
MAKNEVNKAIVKFLGKEANLSDLEGLEGKMSSREVAKTFDEFAHLDYLISLSMQKFDTEEALLEIKKRTSRIRRKKQWYIVRYCAAFAVLFSVLTLTYRNFVTNQNQVRESNEVVITPAQNKAILTLDSGKHIVLDPGKEYKDEDAESSGNVIAYMPKSTRTKSSVAFNMLTIPRGAKFQLKLADGTLVWLNSESQLRYPVNFDSQQLRRVELLYGEAFFDVSPSLENDGKAFIVSSKGQEIEVLGTSFNVNGYLGDAKLRTTLVEGKVRLTLGEGANDYALSPGQQAVVGNGVLISVAEVDVEHETAWVRGLFSFEDSRLSEMMEALSRWYDVEVIFEDDTKKELTYTGILERTNEIEDILEIIKETSHREVDFTVKNKLIIVK